MAVYLDLVMVLNFLVDFLLLMGANRLSGFGAGWKRCVFAAVLGSAYSGACLLPGFRFLGNTLWRTVFLGLMGIIAFGLNRSAVKRSGLFILLSMAMGGIALGLGRNDFGMLLICAGITWLLCRIGFGGQAGGREYAHVTIQEGERTVRLVALRDSGNCLRDPISGEQVLVIGPEDARMLMGLSEEQLRDPMGTVLSRKIPGLRLIPYNSVGQAGGMLLAKRMQNVQVDNWKGSALVAFAPERIGTGDVYRALTGGAI